MTQTLLNEGMIVTDSSELDICKAEAPSFKTVFQTWRAYSHLNGKDNADADDLAQWYYDKDTIVQPKNSASVTGYVSPKILNYDVICSNNTDDDQMGIVGAFAVDKDGKEHTLTFIASPYNNTGTRKWCCKIRPLCV